MRYVSVGFTNELIAGGGSGRMVDHFLRTLTTELKNRPAVVAMIVVEPWRQEGRSGQKLVAYIVDDRGEGMDVVREHNTLKRGIVALLERAVSG